MAKRFSGKLTSVSKDRYDYTLNVNGVDYATSIDVSPAAISNFNKNKNSAKCTPIPIGCERININAFTKKYMTAIPAHLFSELSQRQMQGFNYADISSSVITMIDNMLADRKAEDKRWQQCARLNNKGKEHEKAGKISLAIKTYEKNIEGDCCLASHSFTRLMVLYRQQKDFDNEIRVIEKAIDLFGSDSRYDGDIEKWIARLEKTSGLRDKQK